MNWKKLLLIGGAGLCSGQKLELNLLKPEVIEERLESGAVRSSQRQGVIRKLFAEAGCAAEEQPVGKKSANVVCTDSGQTGSRIVIGGHFDFADRGQGIVDDWSGVSLLPSLYQVLRTQPRRHTYVFVAFAAEERGLVGSRTYVKHLSEEEKTAIHAFVNLECLGLTPAKVWTHRATPELVQRLMEVAGAIHMTLQGANVERVGDDDSHPFLDIKIPVITIHSVTQKTLPILHSARDQVKAIHADEYYDTYRLLAFYLAYLDARLD